MSAKVTTCGSPHTLSPSCLDLETRRAPTPSPRGRGRMGLPAPRSAPQLDSQRLETAWVLAKSRVWVWEGNDFVAVRTTCVRVCDGGCEVHP